MIACDLYYGVGIYDSTDLRSFCPYFIRWRSMIERGYCKILKEKHPSYEGVSVCDEWLLFSNFKRWMMTQDWKNKELDKDILVPGNKVYNSETCVFVTKRTNGFVLEATRGRGNLPIGVCQINSTGKYIARCRSVTLRKQVPLGRFDTPEEAHKAWLAFKLEQAKIIASEQTDARVAQAIISRYENYS